MHIVYAAILFTIAMIAVYIPFNHEDLMHYNCLSFAESVHSASVSYHKCNPRLGELVTYFLGHNARIFYLFTHTTLGFAAVLLMYRLGIGRWPESTGKSISVLILTFVCLLGFNTQTYWFLGNMNWLYPGTIAMAFICLTEGFFRGDFSLSWKKFLLAIPLAFITGMSSFNASIVAWILVTGCAIYHCGIRKSSTITWQYATILAVLTLACLLLYLGPGNFARVERDEWELSISNFVRESLLFPRNWIVLALTLWRIILVGGILLIAVRMTSSQISKVRTSCLLIALLFAWGSVVPTPLWGAPRSLLTVELILTCILAHFFFNAKLNKMARAILLVIQCAIMFTLIIPNAGRLASSHREWERIEAMAESAKKQGLDYLVVRKSQLDFTPTFPRIGGLPGSLFDYRLEPVISLAVCREEQSKHLNHKHVWINGENGYDQDTGAGYETGDQCMNPIAAKQLGLKAIYYIEDK